MRPQPSPRRPPPRRRQGPDWPIIGLSGVILIATLGMAIALFSDGASRMFGDANPEATATFVATPPQQAVLPTATVVVPTAVPSPTDPLANAPTVCLDVGHGGVDEGKLLLSEDGTQILAMEKDFTLAQALALKERLPKLGINVVLTRETDTEVNPDFVDVNGDGEVARDVNGNGQMDRADGDYPDELDELQARVNVCNEAGADLMVSIHINGAENLALNGYEAWYADDLPTTEASAAFAQIVVSELGAQMAAAGYEPANRGAAPDSAVILPEDEVGTFQHFVLLSPDVPERQYVGAKMPSVIVECLFMSNEDDVGFLQTDEGMEAIISAYEAAIVEWFDEQGLMDRAVPTSETLATVPPTPEAAAANVTPTPLPEGAPTPRPEPPPDTGGDLSQMHYYGDSGRREIALTFDAGADRGYAEEILDFLKERGIKASFGMTGAWAEQNSDLVKRMAAEGHQIFNHTYNHCSFTGLSQPECQLTSEERREQIMSTEEIVREITGGYEMAPYFRPPYGDINDAARKDIYETGYYITVMWTCDSYGWKFASPAQIVQDCAGNAQPGGIILLHVGANGTDWEALPALVDALATDDYSFVTVEEILQP